MRRQPSSVLGLGYLASTSTMASAFVPASPISGIFGGGGGAAPGRESSSTISPTTKTDSAFRDRNDRTASLLSRSSTSSSLQMMVDFDFDLSTEAAVEDCSSLSPFLSLPSFFGDFTTTSSPTRSYDHFDSLPTGLISSTTQSLSSSLIIEPSPQVESELFTDASHVALDLVTFAGPTKAFLRLSIVVGRVFAILADYIPDHTILPEEMLFQGIMLTIASTLLARSCAPMLPALMTNASYKDKYAYQALFRQFGLSWMQFKAVSALAGEWIEVPPNGRVDNSSDANGMADDDEDGQGYVYWLQRGEAELTVNDVRVQSAKAGSKRGKADELSLLGELDFSRQLQKRKKQSKKKSRNKFVDDLDATDLVKSTSSPTQSKIKAGPSGATLLRLNSSKLLRLMEDDDELSEGIQSLIFAGMQEKLTRALLAAEEDRSGNANNSTELNGPLSNYRIA